jgi:hypothetical protein
MRYGKERFLVWINEGGKEIIGGIQQIAYLITVPEAEGFNWLCCTLQRFDL